MSEKIEILNIKINRDKLDSIISESISMAKEKRKHYICVPNAYSTVIANRDKDFREIINKAAFTIPDGMPLVWYSKTFKKSLEARISGFELFNAYSRQMDKKKMSCFFFGGKDELVAEAIIKKFKDEFKNIIVSGHYVPPFLNEFKEAEKQKIQKAINSCRPDVVWVGMSAPKQEKWISNNIEDLNIGMACGIGAVFDFYSGEIRRAPGWMQKTGLEWLYRVLADPKRL
ncbi:MAG: WecB/TagA/CpsF family glycosyltransferase, partial [Actinomycetia bacterium]|nr:WecB/TagA/CpsF family glycosyltransferase [Actinomycetes bacterium]